MDLNKTLGIPNKVIHHVWNIFMICLATWLVVIYYTRIFGYYNVRRGILTTPGIIVPQIPCTVLYCITLGSVFDYVFVLGFLYKVSLCNMVIALLCMLIDSFLYLFAHGDYCQLQLEYHNSDCDKRNRYLYLQTALFFFVLMPIWYASANATRRYAADYNRQRRATNLERTPLRKPQTVDSATVEV